MVANFTPLPKGLVKKKIEVAPEALRRVWLNAWAFSLVVFVFISAYNFMYTERLSTFLWIRSSADAGMILIGLSFALSGLCYFWNFMDSKIKYRKDLGLNGFYLVLVHSIYLMFFSTRTPWYGYFESSYLAPTLFALGAVVIFVVMTWSSTKMGVKILGGKNWRRVLRTGYLAYIFSLFHLGLLVYGDWLAWVDERGLPPFSLVVFVFGVLVLLLRLILFLVQLTKKEL